MHTVAVLALDGVLAFDLATPVEIFGRARLPDGRAAYRVRVCAPTDEVDAGVLSLRARWGMDALDRADTIVLPGLADPTTPIPDEVLEALRSAAAGGTRIASICVGAFTLAATGLLDGLRATTHWAAARELSRRYPEVDVDADVLFVDNGQILTSAGAAAGLDLCLHMIRRDHGSAVAADTARVAVMPLERDGGQAQYIVHERPGEDGASLEPLLRWMEENVHRELALDDIAAQGDDEHPDAQPALSRADRHEPAAMAQPVPDPPGATTARNHGARRRAHRPPGRVRLPDDLPGSLQEARRHQPAGLPADVRRDTGTLSARSALWAFRIQRPITPGCLDHGPGR